MKARTEHPHYEILERCGQGGMGVVYRARDRRLNRIVALKFLIVDEPQEGGTGGVQRFRREAEAIAALNHPGIATIFESGEWDGAPFLALEFLSGGTLRDRIRGVHLNVAEIVDYAAQLSSGLAFAHSKGILHRDIKPSNCMFSEHGALKFVDFGLAKPIESEAITQPGSAVGTIAYMAPELLRGEPATVRSDLYSLGAVVYEMAAGRPLYSGGALGKVVQQVLSGSATPLSQVRPDLPPALSAAVDRATAPRSEDRFGSVQEFLDAIRGTASHATTAADFTPTVTISTPSVSATVARRPRWQYGLGALILFAALMAALYSGLHRMTGGALPAETLVVLPFENLGGNPANQVLCDGLQETVTSVLSSAEELRRTTMIVPSSEVRRSQIHTIAEARKQFNATLAVTGSSQKNEDGLDLTLNLTDARILRQKNSRILKIPAGATGSLQRQLADNLGAMLGTGPLLEGRSPSETTANPAAYALFLQGRGAMENRKYEDAAAFFRKAVDADPDFALARTKLAESYLRLNLSSRDPKWLGLADAEVARAAAAGQTREVLMVQALIRKATGNWQDAIHFFEEVLKEDSGNIEAYRLLADTWDSSGHPKEAEEVYRKALNLRPGYWPLYENLGDFYSRHGQYDQAEKALTTGIALNSEAPSLYSNLGAAYFRMGRWADAGRAFEKSLAIKPTALGYANLGTVRFYEGNYAEAAKQCEAATRLQPANPTNWGNLGDALWQIPAEKQRAQAAFQKAADLARQQLAIKEENPALRKTYALYLAKLGQKDEAYRQARRAIEQAPSDGGVRFYAARVYAVTGDRDASFAALKESVGLGYSAREIQQEPDFNILRSDPRYEQIGAASKKISEK